MDVVVTDISVGGFQLKANETFYVGENIVIGESGVVVWLGSAMITGRKSSGHKVAKQVECFWNRPTLYDTG